MTAIQWPLRTIKRAYHVGTLNPSDKRRGSQEGAGLSISQHPEAWRQIARGLVHGDDWVVRSTSGATFLDVYKLSDAHKAIIREWALGEGLATSSPIFEVSYYDDELEDDLRFTATNRAEAEAEAEEVDGEVTVIDGLLATEALQALSFGPCEPIMVMDMVAIAYADLVLELDGAWWSDRLDPIRLSAPRGVIFKRRLDGWVIRKRA
ncbi:hypothetical protein [Bosea massiliensis]|uniref:Uncharacterized protein n=1 Tax=Bosea massiliensis TaxID=151419 RepID=A0ABW0NYS9_9HYPH